MGVMQQKVTKDREGTAQKILGEDVNDPGSNHGLEGEDSGMNS